MKKYTGIVTWFNKVKGYGELLDENGNKYFFTHQCIKNRSLFKVAFKDEIYEFSISKIQKFGLACIEEMTLVKVHTEKSRKNKSKEISV